LNDKTTNSDGSVNEERKDPCGVCGSKEPWKVWHFSDGDSEVACPQCGWDGCGRPHAGTA